MKILSGLILVLLFFALTGCATTIRQGDFTAISTRDVKIDDTNLNNLSGRKVEGKDSRFMFLFIPIGLPKIGNAVDDALFKGRGDLILDAVLYSTKRWWFLIGQNTITVKGTVVNTSDSFNR